MILLRLKAFLVDIFMIMMPIAYAVYFFVPKELQQIVYKYDLMMFYGVVIVLFLYISSQSPGYKAYNLKLVSSRGTKANIFQIIIRYFISLFVFGYVVALFRKDKATLHDLLSKTKVINLT